jgi:dsDNA-specific endonuclease/ATPase MutS2
VALGRALLLALLARGGEVVATTHLSGLKDLGFELERVENASLEFDGDTLRPLFRLTLGLPGESNALKIARRLGIPPAVVERAEAFLGAGRGSEARIAREHAQRARRAALQHLETAEEQRRGAEAGRARIEEQLRLLEEKSRLLEAETERAIDRHLRAAQERGRAALAQLGTLPAGFAEKAAALARFVDELAQAGSLAERRAAYLRTRKKGDSVWLPKYREQCVVQKVDRPKRRIELLYRGLTVEVSFDEVQCPDDFAT